MPIFMLFLVFALVMHYAWTFTRTSTREAVTVCASLWYTFI